MFLVSGCALSPTAKGGGPKTYRYVVIATRTPFYRYGPAQGLGPDFNLSAGQPLTLLQLDFGFSHVRTDSGQTGYVSTDDIAPAPPPPPQSTALKTKPQKSRPPDFDQPNEMPLPANSPSPIFRY